MNICICITDHVAVHLKLTRHCKSTTMLCLVAQSRPTLCDPKECSPPGSSVHEDSPGKNTGICPPPGDLPNPGIKPRSPALQADSLLSEPPTRHEELRTPAGHRASPLPGHKRDTTPFLFSYFFKSVINIFIDLFRFFQVYEYIINL